MRNRIIYGKIVAVSKDDRIIKVRIKDRIEMFYLSRGLMKKFRTYLYKNRLVTFTVSKKQFIYNLNKKIRSIDFFYRIFSNVKRKNKVFYNISLIRNGIKELLNKESKLLYVDFEMNMQDKFTPSNFIQEIIQFGYVLEIDGEVILKGNEYIRPNKFKRVTKRTLKFINAQLSDIHNGINYFQFYTSLKNIIEEYKPKIVVWGKNDIITLNKFYEIHNLAPVSNRSDFINLLQLHKNYYNLKDDLGLVKALDFHGLETVGQTHNAYEDALITKVIFNKFKHNINR